MKIQADQLVTGCLPLNVTVGEAVVAAIQSHDVAARQQRSRLVANLVTERLSLPQCAVRLIRMPSGQPRLEMLGEAPHVSLAWRDDLLLVGIAPRRVGVDFERVGPVMPPPWNVLAPHERATLTAIDDAGARHEAFLRIWTVKEAALKALGTGFAQEPSAMVVAFEAGEARLRYGDDELKTSAVRVDGFGEGSDRCVWACVVL